jgi:hypothetical protein
MYMSKWLKDNQHLAKELITNETIRKQMTTNEYPMDKANLFQRLTLQDQFVAWWYLLETEGKVWIWGSTRLNKFDKALGFHRWNSLVIVIYLLVVPVIQFIEYMLEVSDSLQSGDFSGKYITRSFIFIFTIVAIFIIMSVAQSFKMILPFSGFRIHLVVITAPQFLFNIIGFIVRVSSPQFSVYSQFESYQLVFVCVFTCVFTFFWLLQTILINPVQIYKDDQKALVLPKGSERVETKANITKLNEEYKDFDHSYDKSGAENISEVGLHTNKKPLRSTIKGVAI